MRSAREFPVNYAISFDAKLSYDLIARLQRIRRWLEVFTVVLGLRRSAILTIRDHDLPSVIKTLRDLELDFTIIEISDAGNGFRHTIRSPRPGSPVDYMLAIGDQGLVEAWRSGNHVSVGHFLGYPRCCSKWFSVAFEKYIDPIIEYLRPEFEDNWLSSPVFRYIGTNLVFHIPHSSSCAETAKLLEQHLAVARDVFEFEPPSIEFEAELSIQNGILQLESDEIIIRAPTVIGPTVHSRIHFHGI